jgi:L-lactate dehydrogenase complex protein LldG
MIKLITGKFLRKKLIIGIRMSNREKILATVKQNQPVSNKLPLIVNYDQHYEDVVEKYIEVLRFIGGDAILVSGQEQLVNIIKGNFQHVKRIVSTIPELAQIAEVNPAVEDPHNFADVDLFITTSNLAVAENGAVWLKDEQLHARALPFIAQQIAVVITKESIVATMHDAYDFIADKDYGYAAFIAGPSKTADIAQSLVLGAHGPKTMTVFIVQ